MAVTPLVVTDISGAPVGSTADYDLDLDYGLGTASNDFTLTVHGNIMPVPGGLVFVDGTDVGGVVDRLKDTVSNGESTLTWTGRTWSGVLAGKVIQPDNGSDYLRVSGPVSSIVSNILSRVGLDSTFTVDSQSSSKEISGYSFDRYVDAWTGVSKLLKSSGLKLSFRETDNTVYILISPIVDHVEDTDLIDFTVEKTYRRVNHLIGLGAGQLKNRRVVHWYADADGKVSKTQTLRGVDEIAATYDYSSDDQSKFDDDVRKKLLDAQGEGTVDVTVPDGISLDIGDIVHGRDNESGLTVTAQVARKIVKASNGLMSVSYQVGEDTSTTGSLLSSGSNSSGGVVYTAGNGITISGGVISSQVSKNDIDGVNGSINQAKTDAQNALQQATQALSLAQAGGGVKDVSNLIWLSDYRFSERHYAHKMGGLVVMVFRFYNDGSSFYMNNWDSHQIMSIDSSISDIGGEFNFQVGNNTANTFGIQVNGSSVNVRCFSAGNFNSGSWLQGVVSWPCYQ